MSNNLYRPSRAQLCSAVWFYNVQCRNRLLGWLTEQGKRELEESIQTFRLAEAVGVSIPSMREACDYYNG